MKILVGIPLDVHVGMELLSWAINEAAHEDDTVVALHVLGERNPSVSTITMRRTKAFVISLLGEFVDLSHTKQVNLEAKVGQSSSTGRGLVEEAASLEATYLVVGGSRNPAQRPSFEITKYCLEHAPEGCMVIAVGTHGLPQQDSDSDSVIQEGVHRLSSGGVEGDTRVGKAHSPLQRLLGSRKKRGGSFDKGWSPTEGKASPRTVLDGPEERGHQVQDYFTLSSNETGRFRHWRRLSVVRKLFPFLHSESDAMGTEGCLPNKESMRPSWRCFSYDEISYATNNFHSENMVGRGGFAEVYRGVLDGGQVIAVKKLAKGGVDMHKEREFLEELGILGHVCHPNTGYLIGCCIENGLHLIFDFSPNGSLASALHGRSGKLLEWPVRYKIATGIARGLHYLHKCCRRRIIHRDIKASNILLGEDFEPQISDFGLAKWLPKQWSCLSIIPIEGTFGYLAPEYFMHGIVDEKTDVFAFGVLLLEIITGRKPVDTSKQSLILWAKPRIQSGNITELADPHLEGNYDREQMEKMVLTASYCIRQSAIWRPSMNEVLQLITGGHNSKVADSWRMPESRADGIDDYTSHLDYNGSF